MPWACVSGGVCRRKRPRGMRLHPRAARIPALAEQLWQLRVAQFNMRLIVPATTTRYWCNQERTSKLSIFGDQIP